MTLSPIAAPRSLLFSNTKEINLQERHDTGEPKIEIEKDNKENEI